jgi:hypothetical protein
LFGLFAYPAEVLAFFANLLGGFPAVAWTLI